MTNCSTIVYRSVSYCQWQTDFKQYWSKVPQWFVVGPCCVLSVHAQRTCWVQGWFCSAIVHVLWSLWHWTMQFFLGVQSTCTHANMLMGPRWDSMSVQNMHQTRRVHVCNTVRASPQHAWHEATVAKSSLSHNYRQICNFITQCSLKLKTQSHLYIISACGIRHKISLQTSSAFASGCLMKSLLVFSTKCQNVTRDYFLIFWSLSLQRKSSKVFFIFFVK